MINEMLPRKYIIFIAVDVCYCECLADQIQEVMTKEDIILKLEGSLPDSMTLGIRGYGWGWYKDGAKLAANAIAYMMTKSYNEISLISDIYNTLINIDYRSCSKYRAEVLRIEITRHQHQRGESLTYNSMVL